MHSTQSVKHVLSIAAAAALLAGCSNAAISQLAPAANSRLGAAGITHHGHVFTTSVLNPKFPRRESNTQLRTHPLHGKIAANVKTLWLSDSGDNDIQIYTFPTGTYIGTAPPPPEGFSEPQGMCSDKAGDVFVANTNKSTIDEYAGNGTFMQALSDPGEFPVGCGVDPASGTLAVSNIISTSDNAGGISLYKNASGSPRQLTDPNMFEIYFIAYYGSTGKLYYSGFDNSFDAAISSYANGTFKILTLNGATIDFPGTVAWANKTKSLAIGDQDTFSGPTFYHVKANGNVTGSTVLACQSSSCDVPQATVKGKYIVAGTGVFAYPAGGDPLFIIRNSLDEEIGSAVSVVKQ
jgi:DNA-binding beta-propeller fold protein YncE